MLSAKEKSAYPRITIILPTKNEEPALRTGLVRDFKKYADEVIVVDGNSSDRTREIAISDGARVFNYGTGGKGGDIRLFQDYVRENPKAFGDILVMNDGDRTCRPEDVEKLVKPIIDGKADVVIGSRFDKIEPEPGSTRSIQKFGNLAAAALTNILYHRRDLKDATCPSWAFKKDFLVNEHLTAKCFDLEAELLAKTIFGGYRLETVSVKQEKREGRSKFLGFDYLKIPIYTIKYYTLGLLRSSKD